MAEFKIEWSTEARLDLIDVLEFYIQRNGSSSYSKKLYAQINNGLKLVAKNPSIGVQTDFPDTRTLITGDYQIIYVITEKTILVVMLWDCRRNPDDKRVYHQTK
jgi:plasmid stabilization system protein ParE